MNGLLACNKLAPETLVEPHWLFSESKSAVADHCDNGLLRPPSICVYLVLPGCKQAGKEVPESLGARTAWTGSTCLSWSPARPWQIGTRRWSGYAAATPARSVSCCRKCRTCARPMRRFRACCWWLCSLLTPGGAGRLFRARCRGVCQAEPWHDHAGLHLQARSDNSRGLARQPGLVCVYVPRCQTRACISVPGARV